MVRVDPFAYFFCALLLLTLPLRWVLAAIFAAAFHEVCHIAAICLTGNRIYQLHIGIGGAKIRTDLNDPRQELLCALAGPAGSLVLLLLYRTFPRLALCGGVQGIFNLLPIYPMDGGRALSCMLEMWLPKYREVVLRWAEGTVLFLLLAMCICLRQGFFPIAASILLICRPFLRKIPCKPGRIKVQ